ncbi:MAG TPA: metal ABC transporter permease [Solirubrobacteraceae bacterium]
MLAALSTFEAPYMQRALAEILLLAVPGGLLGAWIVLRRLAFYTHALGTAAFPGLVVAGPWGIPPQLAALGCGLGLAGGLQALARRPRIDRDAATGLLLVAALAGGVILASDVYASGAGVDRLLFGSLIAVGDADLWLSAGVALLSVAAAAGLRRPWLASGFDPGTARTLGVRGRGADGLLLALVACAVVVALDAVGALLVAVVFILPAATVRLVARSVTGLQLGSVALAAAEGVAGLWLARRLDVGPGPAMAMLGGAVFAFTAAWTRP